MKIYIFSTPDARRDDLPRSPVVTKHLQGYNLDLRTHILQAFNHTGALVIGTLDPFGTDPLSTVLLTQLYQHEGQTTLPALLQTLYVRGLFLFSPTTESFILFKFQDHLEIEKAGSDLLMPILG